MNKEELIRFVEKQIDNMESAKDKTDTLTALEMVSKQKKSKLWKEEEIRKFKLVSNRDLLKEFREVMKVANSELKKLGFKRKGNNWTHPDYPNIKISNHTFKGSSFRERCFTLECFNFVEVADKSNPITDWAARLPRLSNRNEYNLHLNMELEDLKEAVRSDINTHISPLFRNYKLKELGV